MPPNLPFSVTLRVGEPVAEQVIYAVTRAVVTGQLRPGDPFPSVRVLSQQLRINPNTAHRIVAALTDEGLLIVRPGIGTVVSDTIRPDPGRRADVAEEIERLVVGAKRSGLTLQQVLSTIRGRWNGTSRRAG